ncbi:helix-turn-helix domain-containing protein [Microvirgula aerodenitrificans]
MSLASTAELIRRARKKVAKNQQDFGSMLGKDQSLVSRYERGLASPPS